MVVATKRARFLAKLDALPGVHVAPAPPEDGITLADAATKYGLTINGMKYRLEKLVRQGTLVTSWAMRSGNRVKVYRFRETTG